MKKIFLNRVKFIVPSIDTALLEGKILLEEKSCDTEDNAHQV